MLFLGKPLFPGFPPVSGSGDFDLIRHQQLLAAAGIPTSAASSILESSGIKIPTAHRPGGGAPGGLPPPPGSTALPGLPGSASAHAAQQAQAAAQAQFDYAQWICRAAAAQAQGAGMPPPGAVPLGLPGYMPPGLPSNLLAARLGGKSWYMVYLLLVVSVAYSPRG